MALTLPVPASLWAGTLPVTLTRRVTWTLPFTSLLTAEPIVTICPNSKRFAQRAVLC